MAIYTDEGYEQFFQNPKWTKEQTDDLFDLCQQLDLRFIVIADRFKRLHPGFCVEDLRDRYYSIARKQVERQAETNPTMGPLEENPMFQFKYDPGMIISNVRIYSSFTFEMFGE